MVKSCTLVLVSLLTATLGLLPAEAQQTIGAEFQVNTYTTLAQYDTNVASDAAGNFVVVWQSWGSSGSDDSEYSVQGQSYGVQILFADGFESGDTSAW